jgi:hypothetical protein
MSRTLYVKLNNYDYSDDFLDQLKDYLEFDDIPDDWSPSQIKIFKRRYKNYHLEGNKIIYTPLNLEVVHENDIDTKLKVLYNDDRYGAGKGIRSFYNTVISKYLGIKRTRVADFLKQQPSYQLTKTKQPLVNKPIVARFPNQRWSIDLIDMAQYKKRK